VFALKTVLSLSDLWREQGASGQTQKLVTEILDSLSEGFDPLDLRIAEGVLDELA